MHSRISPLAFIGLFGTSAYSKRDPTKREDVAIPPADAQPDEVVRAYASAVPQRDGKTDRRISTGLFLKREPSVPDSPFCNWTSTSRITVSEPEEIEFQEGEHKHAVHAGVRFRTARLREIFMKNGYAVWGYVLVRYQENDRWRWRTRVCCGPCRPG